MNDYLYEKVSKRVERRLSTSATLVVLNTLLFSLFTVPVGLWSKFTHGSGTIDGRVYWVIVLWSIGLFMQTAFTYARSGARRKTREKIIQEEVLDAGDIYNLSPDEMIDLHLRQSSAVQIRTKPLHRVMQIAVGNVVLWPGVLIAAYILFNMTHIVSDAYFSLFFNTLLVLALIGSLVLGLMLPVRELWSKKEDVHDNLRAIYGYKRKRGETLELHDEEIAFTPEAERIDEPLDPIRKQK